jgi:hypothetical protein
VRRQYFLKEIKSKIIQENENINQQGNQKLKSSFKTSIIHDLII